MKIFGLVRHGLLLAAQEALHRAVQMQLQSYIDLGKALGEMKRLEVDNARLRSDMDWFKHRLNAMEGERGQLIQAAIGVKISVPQFVPSDDPHAALNEMPDLSSVGNDALDDEQNGRPDLGNTDLGVNYTMLPGYKE